MLKPYIVTTTNHGSIDFKIKKMFEYGIHGCKKYSDFRILKIRPKPIGNDFGSIDLRLQYHADIIFDVGTNRFHKNRYGMKDDVDDLPLTLLRIFKPIRDILRGKKFSYLRDEYTHNDLVEALYLTDTFGQFRDRFNELDYILMRLKYGQRDDISKQKLAELVEKHPEKLI